MEKTNKLMLAAMGALLIMAAGCHKPNNMAPEPDTEFQSSVDASFAATVISDIDMVCGFAGEDDFFPKFYVPCVANRDENGTEKRISISFNNSKCADGKVRDGSIFIYYDYSSTNPNARYYYSYQFQGKVFLVNYRIDGRLVELKNTFTITNLLPSPVFDPKKTNLSWSMNGDFVIRDLNDSSKNIHCNVDLVKTLVNTSDPKVFNPDKKILTPITWSLATVEYRGSMFGETSRIIPFSYKIKDANPLTRDFTCFPDKVSGMDNTGTAGVFQEFHPFVKGSATFVTNNLYPRDIAYGDEQNVYHDVKNSPVVLNQQCDNKGIVTIKGISYDIDFDKTYQ